MKTYTIIFSLNKKSCYISNVSSFLNVSFISYLLIEAVVVDDKLRQRDRLIAVDHAAGIVAVGLGTHEGIDHSCVIVDMTIDMPSAMTRSVPFSQRKMA